MREHGASSIHKSFSKSISLPAPLKPVAVFPAVCHQFGRRLKRNFSPISCESGFGASKAGRSSAHPLCPTIPVWINMGSMNDKPKGWGKTVWLKSGLERKQTERSHEEKTHKLRDTNQFYFINTDELSCNYQHGFNVAFTRGYSGFAYFKYLVKQG